MPLIWESLFRGGYVLHIVEKWLLTMLTISSIGFWANSGTLFNTILLILPLFIMRVICWYHSLVLPDENVLALDSLYFRLALFISILILFASKTLLSAQPIL